VARSRPSAACCARCWPRPRSASCFWSASEPTLWTREAHFEIAAHLKQLEDGEPVDPPRLFEELSDEAGALAGELLLDEDSPVATTEVLDDFIRIIERHHARRREHENLQLLLGKVARNESATISDEEKARFEQATRETKRRVPPEA
jgi:hypothetical protein